MIHKRNVQKTGKSTYTISLPKKWVKTNIIKAKDRLILKERDDALIIYKEISKNKQIIDVKDKPVELIERKLISLYVKGVDTIRIYNLSRRHKNDIVEFVSKIFMGFELMKDIDYLEFENILDYKKYPLMNTIKRIKEISEWMIKESFKSLELDNRKDILEEIIEKDKDVDKLSLFAIRIINGILNNKYESLVDMDNYKLISLYGVVSRMENIADYVVNISYSVKILKKIKNLEIPDFSVFVKNTINSLRDILDYMDNKDIEELNKLINSLKIKDLKKAEYMYEFNKKVFSSKNRDKDFEKYIPYMTIILENLFLINSTLKDIGEYIIDGFY